MSPKDDAPKEPVRGSGPGGRVELADIGAKLREIRGEVDDTTDGLRPYITYAVVAGGVVIVVVSFVLGRRRGKRKATWVEVRRL